MQQITPKTISNFIQGQFPNFYQENGDTFVAFVRAYYEWMESPDNPLYLSRNYYEIKDIDNTLSQFVVYFKEKYLKNIQLTTETDTRMLVKHALDIYRSKGTPRCIELLFQLVFGTSARFYFPGTDLFKLSDGTWYRPTYLEITLSETNINLINKEIIGLNSGATAFVDDVVRRMTNGRLEDILYISAVTGTFEHNELIKPIDNSLDINLCPKLLGSLHSVLLPNIGTGNSYVNGNIIEISSLSGNSALGSVANTTIASGLLDYVLIDGGYGYTNTANVIVANTEIVLSNVQIANMTYPTYCLFQETLTQPLANITFVNCSALIDAGNNIFTYWGNGSVKGQGTILSINYTNSTAGELICYVQSGDLDEPNFYTTGNAQSANEIGYVNTTAIGTYIANTDQVILGVANTDGFILGEKIVQGWSYGLLESINTISSELTINSISGKYINNIWLIGETSNTSSNVTSIEFKAGVIMSNNQFFGSPFTNIVTGSLITAQCTQARNHTGNNVLLQKGSLSLEETVNINTDRLSNYFSVVINATAYGFPANPTANLSSGQIGSCFTYQVANVGKISSLDVVGYNDNYTFKPLVVVDEELVRYYDIHDNLLIRVSGNTQFDIGEVITQPATSARGTVLNITGDYIYIQQNRFYPNNNFIITSNSTTVVTGLSSGTTANIATVWANRLSTVSGHNLKNQSTFALGDGVLLELNMLDSGFGFSNGEVVSLISDTANAAVGIAVLDGQGVGRGYYKQKGGFLSDQKKLFDGVYYQNFSYEIISKIMLNKYKDMILNIAHPAGMAMFGKLVHFNNIEPVEGHKSIETAILTQS